jgi:MerR family transcriptional regulator, thiopeptide resistance regulator
MTITQLARKHGLSRSTLLYYDRIGLLPPDGRFVNDYRHYGAAAERRLRQIRLYRETGLPLAEIRRILQRPKQDLAAALERQLHEVVTQVDALRSRQRIIVELLKSRRLLDRVQNMDRERWVKLLHASGFTDDDLRRWHVDFERTDPDYHQRFMEFLGIPADQIRRVREFAQAALQERSIARTQAS